MATHSSIAWRVTWIEVPGGLQSLGTQWVGHDWSYWAPHARLSSSQWNVNRNDIMSLLTLTHKKTPVLILHLLFLFRVWCKHKCQLWNPHIAGTKPKGWKDTESLSYHLVPTRQDYIWACDHRQFICFPRTSISSLSTQEENRNDYIQSCWSGLISRIFFFHLPI